MFFDTIENFKNLINDPEVFRHQNSNFSENFREISKSFYEKIIPSNVISKKSKTLKSLLLTGFDDEQVWQQLELQNKNAAQHLDKWISEISSQAPLTDFDVKYNNIPVTDINHDNKLASDKEIEHDSDSEDYNSANETSAIRNTSDEDSDFDETKDESTKKKDNSYQYKSKVDDQFFKLSKLEEFLRVEDLKEENARDGDLDESDEEEDIDLFQNISSDEIDESEDEDESNKKSTKDYMYEDFFDVPESGAEQMDELSDLENEKLDSDDNANILPEEDDSEEDDEDEEFVSNKKSKTPFEMEQENIKKRISEYEESMVTPKPWQLTGEVDISNRPIDGLLDLPTDFETNAKPMVIQDKEFCEKLENMIKMTIKNKSYSDGVRQEKPVKEIINTKKEIVVDQNKSKKGLAQEYEEMYLKKQSKQEDEENPKHQEIQKFMNSLFPELYALFSHIPKPAVPDIKIVSNLPAITVEEVAPTSHSDVTLLAPEEIKRRTGLTKGHTERTDTDRHRERRKKKLQQKMKQKKKEKENENKPLSAKAKKQDKLQVLKKLRQNKNTKIATVSGEKIKSSRDFFARLQETVTSKINKDDVKQAKKKKKKV